MAVVVVFPTSIGELPSVAPVPLKGNTEELAW